MEYRDSEPIRSAARGFSARDETLGCLDGTHCVWPFGNAATPAGVYSVPDENALGLAAGRYTADAPGAFRLFRAAGPQNDLYSTQADTFLRAGRSGASVVANGGYELSEATQLKFDVLASTDRSRRQLAPLPLSTALEGTITLSRDPTWNYLMLPPAVAYNNYYNPFGAVITDVRRRLVELGPRSLTNNTDSVLVAGSARHITAAWTIDSSISAGRLQATERVSHVLREDLLSVAVGPSGPDASGVIRCGFPDPETGIVTEPLPDCVPIDLFHGPGTLTQPMLDYVTTSREEETQVTQTQARVIARREVSLGASRRPARAAVGIESRRLNAHFDFPTYDWLTGSNGGSVQQHDLMSEMAWPLGDSRAGAESMVLTTGGRVSWFENRSLIGSAFAAALWRPSSQLLLRSRITQIHRAPSAGEMYLGHRERVRPVNAPCAGPAGEESILCQWVGGVVEAPPVSVEAPYFTEGNPDLRPERGYGASVGVVWNVANEYVGLDFTWVQLNNAIRAPGAIEVLESCRDLEQDAACRRIIPVDSSITFAIDGRPMNGGRDESARLDLEARRAGSTKWGDWRAESFASYLLIRELADIRGDTIKLRGIFDVTQTTTGAAYPALRWQGRLQWSRAPWTARWMMQYVGPVDEMRDRNGFLLESGGALRRVGSTVYHDISLSWAERSPWSVQIDVENVFDRAPPRVNNGFEANTDSPSYRLEGRLYSLSVKFSS
jgi:iron complex outermembrane receptor protein